MLKWLIMFLFFVSGLFRFFWAHWSNEKRCRERKRRSQFLQYLYVHFQWSSFSLSLSFLAITSEREIKGRNGQWDGLSSFEGCQNYISMMMMMIKPASLQQQQRCFLCYLLLQWPSWLRRTIYLKAENIKIMMGILAEDWREIMEE